MASKPRSRPSDVLTPRFVVHLRDGIDAMNERLDVTHERIERLERRQTENAVRLATALVGVADAVGEVRDLLRDQRIDRRTLAEHESRITKLEGANRFEDAVRVLPCGRRGGPPT